MPMVSGLIENGMGRTLPDWVGKAEFVTSDDGSDLVAMNGLIKKLGVTRNYTGERLLDTIKNMKHPQI